MAAMRHSESPLDHAALTRMASALRILSADMVEAANSGHPGLPLGMADAAAVLFAHMLRYNPQDPEWPCRDRFILSAGHGSALLYSALHLAGYPGMTLENLQCFRQLHSPAAGHPEYGEAPGIETTTGPLGQGLANAVGMALGQKIAEARFGTELAGHYTYVIAGDGCLMEGISHEAISLAGKQKLNKLIVLFDNNGITIDGRADISCIDDQRKRFEASGWDVFEADGHDFASVYAALNDAKASPNPAMIITTTTIGKHGGAKAGSEKCHGSPLGAEGIADLRETLGWKAEPFILDESVYADWKRDISGRKQAYDAWKNARKNLSGDRKDAYETFLSGAVPAACYEALGELKRRVTEKGGAVASRKSSLHAIEAVMPHAPDVIGGSADLTGSNCTLSGGMTAINDDNPGGNYLYYGIREHAMAAAMNGLALYGFVPFGGTFLVFTDYCRPAIRLSALMKQRVIYVMTHDSIGLGEDGPTHQPVEHLSALRAIPNLNVLRPADAAETAECWEIALQSENTPSVLALSRQNLPLLRTDYVAENKSANGAYILREHEGGGAPEAVLIASGSEVSIAEEAGAKLAAAGVKVRLVSAPCLDILAEQDSAYLDALLPAGAVHAVIEAGIAQSWHRFVNKNALFFTVETFGASAPYLDVYAHSGITPEAIEAGVSAALKQRR